MNFTPVKAPNVAKRMFPNYVWDIHSTNKTIYLTFDDGPTPEITNWTLDVLKQYNAKATFFCIGKNVKKHPDIFQDILNDGHTIGNHTNNHVKGWRSSTKNYLANIDEAQKIINSEVKNNQSQITNLFRPPYGQIRPKQGKALLQLNYKIVMWNVLTFDWDHSISNKTCLENVIDNTTDGSIVVFHDSIKASNNMKYTLPRTLEHFSKKGYAFKSIKI